MGGFVMQCYRIPLIAAAVLSAAFSQVSVAADMPVKAPIYKAAPAAVSENWTGFYIGANFGYALDSNRTVTFTPNDPVSFAGTCGGLNGSTCAGPTSFDLNGIIGGIQAGYNWQFNRSLLLGIETDFQWSRIDGASTSPVFNLAALGLFFTAPSSFNVSEKIKWLGTVRGRLGWLPSDDLLVYATGGFAYGRITASAVLNSVANTNLQAAVPPLFGYVCVAGPACFVGSGSRTATGWAAGGGIEYLFLRSWSLKAEYLYVNLEGGSFPVVAVATSGVAGVAPASFTAAYSDLDLHFVRLGVNRKF